MNVDISFFILPFFLFPLRYIFDYQNWQKTIVLFSISIIAYHSILSALTVILISTMVYLIVNYKPTFKYLGIICIIIGFFIVKTYANTFTLIGYSYYSLQLISVLVNPLKQQKFIDILLGTTFFPKFFSGPILKNNQFVLTSNLHNDFAIGIVRLVWGLTKIFILSNRLQEMISGYFEYPTEINNGLIAVISSILFTFQMYINFSGFTDIAIGLGRILGVNLPENFDLPLRSKNISTYWRKTHITLISWFTQFIFYPILYLLKKHPKSAFISGTLLVFITSGIWHNLQIGFIIWGLINAFYIITEHFFKLSNKKIPFLNVFYVIPLISFANFFFKLGNWQNITKSVYKFSQVDFFPKNFMSDIVAILGKGGYLEQQYHLVETLILLITFLIFEKKINHYTLQPKQPIIFVLIAIYILFIFGNFSQNNQFIYLQF